MGDFRELAAWKASRVLAHAVYRLTATFPVEERFGLTTQMRRAAVSIMSNVAEGAGRGTDRQFLAMLYIACGSLRELQSQCILSADLGLGSVEGTSSTIEAADHAGRVLQGLIRAIRGQVESTRT